MIDFITYTGITDVGQVRTANEDRWYANKEQGLYVVADGMGGTSQGGLAAEAVVKIMPPLLDREIEGCRSVQGSQTAKQIKKAIAEMSHRLREEGLRHVGTHGLGSTIVLALIQKQHALIAHLGDSRAYLLHNRKIKKITNDHNFEYLLADTDRKALDPKELKPLSARLTRFVGMLGEAVPDIAVVPLHIGDQLLLCSDGLHGMLTEKSMEIIINNSPNSHEACCNLIAAANKAGGLDNITALLVEIEKAA